MKLVTALAPIEATVHVVFLGIKHSMCLFVVSWLRNNLLSLYI